MEDSDKHVPKQLIPYQWKKGQSGNLNGRPKGKTLKEFAREYLESLSDSEKIDYLASLPTDIVWKMAEGNPDSKIDTPPAPVIVNNNIDLDTLAEKMAIKLKEKKV